MNFTIRILVAQFLLLSLSHAQSVDSLHLQTIKQKEDSIYSHGMVAVEKKSFATANKALSALLSLQAMDYAILLRNSYYYQVMRDARLSETEKIKLIQKNFKIIHAAGMQAIQEDNNFVHSNDIMMWLTSLGDIKRARDIEALFMDKLKIDKNITWQQKQLMRGQQLETIYVQGQRALYYYKDPIMLEEIINWLNEYPQGRPWSALLTQEELEENLRKEISYLSNSDSSNTECYPGINFYDN